MNSTVVEDADVVTYVVVCDPGDEAVAALNQTVQLATGHFVREEAPAEVVAALRDFLA